MKSELCTARVGVEELTYQAFGSGPAVLCLNGLGASWHAFRSQIAHLEPRYRCLAWDYRGVLRDPNGGHESRVGSSGARTIADHARDALAILEHEGAARSAILAWSLGVQVALELFRMAPHRISLLILVGGGARASWGRSPEAGPLRRFYPAILSALERVQDPASLLMSRALSAPEAFTWARRVGLVGPELDPESFLDVARDLERLDMDVTFATLREMASLDLSRTLSMIDVPTLVLGGDRDPFASRAALERLVHMIAGAEYMLLPGAGHYLLLDHAQHVNLRIDKFLAERGFSGRVSTPSLHPR
jgi:pimeloyl-ACP methyl ester carboxylesterase